MDGFSSAKLKIERANKHNADIDARIVSLEKSNTVSFDTNPDTGQKFLKHDLSDRTAASDISLMIGDTIHNLRIGLDHAWSETLQRHARSAFDPDHAKFPVYANGDHLESTLRGSKINTECPRLIDDIVTKIKPYSGGNDSLWPIHRFDILDKHRLLLPIIQYASIEDIEMEDETGYLRSGYSVTEQLPPWFVHIPEGWNVKKEGKPSIGVLFGEGTPENRLSVKGMLPHYSAVVLKVVEFLENF